MQDLLVRLPNHLGDACMALPALERLASAHGRTAVAGRPWVRELLAARPWNIVALPGNHREDVHALRKAAASLESPRGVLFTNSFSSALEFRRAGVPAEGYARDARSLLLRRAHRVPTGWSEGTMHTVEYFWALALAVLGEAPSPAPAPDLARTPDAEARARAALARAGVAGPHVVLCPAARGMHRGRVKRWDGFARLCGAIEAAGARPIACPGPGEEESVREAVPAATQVGPLDLQAFAALLRASRLVIANDSGASHLASAVGARLLTVFGVTEPARTRPYGPGSRILGNSEGWPDYEAVAAAVAGALRAP